MGMSQKYVVWFADVDKDDGKLVGGKGANLGEMTRAGFPVPNGFIVTSHAYSHFLKENNLESAIRKALSNLDSAKTEDLQNASETIKKEIIKGLVPKDVIDEILVHYHKLDHPLKTAFKDPLVAVRSSATAEDLKDASFAGQQETFLNVSGGHNLIESIKKVWASLFEARAIFYREQQKIDHLTVGIAVPVQQMVESVESGVMFTVDPVTNDKSSIIIEAIYGLGEFIVQGIVTPDHYKVDKKTLEIIEKDVRVQEIMLKKQGAKNSEVQVPKAICDKQKISDSQIKKLAEIGLKLEKHYFFPQDVEWAVEAGKIYIVQTRPVTTVHEVKMKNASKIEGGMLKLDVLLRGDPASPGIGTGPVAVIHTPSEIGKVQRGDVLVAEHTSPDFVPAMKKASAIVTQQGGRTSHAAIVSRELGIPAVVGVEFAMKLLKDGLVVTVNGATGEIYKGGVESSKFKVKSEKFEAIGERIKTKTKLYVNLGEPERAEEVAAMDVDGVGLLRAEFVIANIGIHPKKLIAEHKKKVFVDALSEKLQIFCKAFAPRPVMYRLSDFKTNEYRNLSGGAKYEPQEENPMIGFRGSYRFLKDPEVFELELSAIKRVRNVLGFKNLWIMVPFARTPLEFAKVKKQLSAHGLERSNTLKIWLMIETPANVILFEEFIKEGVDGISIGSNDLTMLTLGVDRDNTNVASIFDEQNEAVMRSIEHVIKLAKRHNITSSICGQFPSVYPESIKKLVAWGITSVSVSPDAVSAARRMISEVEKKERSS